MLLLPKGCLLFVRVSVCLIFVVVEIHVVDIGIVCLIYLVVERHVVDYYDRLSDLHVCCFRGSCC